MWVYIFKEIIMVLEFILFVIALYLFLKANEIIGRKIKNSVIWIIIAILFYEIYLAIVNMLYYFNVVSGDLWIALRTFFGTVPIYALLISAYYLKNMFKRYKVE